MVTEYTSERLVSRTRALTLCLVFGSISLHVGLVILAEYTVGVRLLANATLVLVVFLAGMIAAQRLSIIIEPRGIWLTIWTASGLSLTLMVVGIMTAAIIERTNLTPAVSAALFAPWWYVYLTAMLWQLAKTTPFEARWVRPFSVSAMLAVFPTAVAFLLNLAFVT